MNDCMIALELEGLQNLYSESADQARGNSLEIVLLDEFVKIYAQELKGDKQVLSENVEIQNADDVVFIVFVAALEILEQSELNASLVLEPLLVADHLDGHHLLILVVKALQGLPETARAKFIEDLPPVCEVVLHNYLIVASLVVVAIVVALESGAFDLLGFQAQEVDFCVVLDFYLLVVGEPGPVES